MRSAVTATLVLSLAAACGSSEPSSPPAPSAATAAPTATAAPVTAALDAGIKVDALRTVVVQEVPPGVKVEAPADGPLAVVAMLQITFEGAPMARVMGGNVDPGVIEGDPRRIKPLVSFYETWAKSAPGGPRVVNVAIVPQANAGVLMDLLGSFVAAGQREFALIVRAPDGPGALPVRLADPAAPPGAGDVTHDIVLTLDGDRAYLWSKNGVHGTAARPLLAVTRSDADAWPEVRAALVEMLDLYGGAARTATRFAFTVAAADAVPVGDVLAAVVTARHDDRGDALFADVRLARHVPPAPDRGRQDRTLAALSLQDQAALYADLLSGEGGAVDDTDLRRRPGAELGAQLDAVRDQRATVAIGGGAGDRALGGGAIADPTRDRPAAPTGRITIASREALDSGTPTANDVVRKVMSAYMAGLRRCYTQRLKLDPEARGKVRLQITLRPNGRVANARATGFLDEIDRCFEAMTRSWSFPAPKDDDGEPIEASFVLAFLLDSE